ncbi:hypothetical protein [Microbacterium sp. VKM Ac-2923]|uniref:hypothetical protein n=1 Tax=Microbacterium sp. VKM Ac-2923 TaxID=2929476 RepID=UPI001FB1DF7C|nr:hypothetical protein [Microbacterium sp. VKM Ac-2923]MCJ1709004.1 hypothetical protein [Microbacterium sp. VKM Ac-2923]
MSVALAACTSAPTSGLPAQSTPPISGGPAQSTSPTSPVQDAGSSASAYRDGTYQARGWYGGLPSHHDVTLTIADGSVTDVEITTPAQDETSLGYQQRFADALPNAVVGRPVDELAIDRLAGSSGCSEGFMNALAQIRNGARL